MDHIVACRGNCAWYEYCDQFFDQFFYQFRNSFVIYFVINFMIKFLIKFGINLGSFGMKLWTEMHTIVRQPNAVFLSNLVLKG